MLVANLEYNAPLLIRGGVLDQCPTPKTEPTWILLWCLHVPVFISYLSMRLVEGDDPWTTKASVTILSILLR